MRGLWFAAAAVGFASMLGQLAALRELLSVFSGNELVIGLVLSIWLGLTGLGGYAAGKGWFDEEKAFELTLPLSAVLLPATVYLSKTVSSYFAVRGEMSGLPQVMAATLLTLAPYCLLYGFQLTLACSILARKGGLNQGYMLDSAGSALGGLAFAFALVTMSSFNVAYAAALVNVAAFFIVTEGSASVAVGVAVLLVSVGGLVDFQSITDRMQYPGQKVLAHENTRYGSLVVTESGGQVNFFENGVPLFSTRNTIRSEETIHYAMAQRDAPKRVLLIGGGVSGTLNELLKYPVEEVDYVELDPEVIELAREYVNDSGLTDPRVKVYNTDGRLFVKNALGGYDVIVVDLPGPSTAQLNRFYTAEFFGEAKNALNMGGVLSIGLDSSGDYMSSDAKALNAGLYSTLGTAFGNVIVLPAGRNVFLASDSALSYDIASLVKKRGVKTEYVNQYYLNGILTKDRLQYIKTAVSGGGQVNTDYQPVTYLQYMRYWMAYFNLGRYLPYAVGALVLAAGLFYLRLKPAQANLFAAGFTGIALEVVMLLFFQAGYGFIYREVGVIVAAFMIGLVAGAHIATRKNLRMEAVVLSSAAYSLLLPAAVLAAKGLSPTYAQMLYPLLTAAAGAFAGMAFTSAAERLAGTAGRRGALGSAFGLDFAGAFAGSLVTSVFLIPAVGLISTCFVMAAMNFMGYLRLKIG